MTPRPEKLKAELIEKLAGLARKKLDRNEAAMAERFVRACYARVSPGEILDRAPDDLLSAALALLRFGAARKVGKAKVRVYNPRFEEHGWTSPHTVVEIVNDDMPFLVDSVTADLNDHALAVHAVMHPVVRVKRDRKGGLVAIVDREAEGAEGRNESFMHLEVDRQSSAREMGKIRKSLEGVLRDVRVAVEDWQPMRAKLAQVLEEFENAPLTVPEEDAEEAKDFLRWIDDNQFTFLGYREYEVTGEDKRTTGTIVEGSGLGILRDPGFTVFATAGGPSALPPDVRQFIREPRLVLISKANRKATVHRPVHMDSIGVKKFDAKGKVVGGHGFVGLFTSQAYNLSPRFIPVLRQKVERTVARAGFDPVSHDGKALLNILETFPRDELFQISEDELFEIGFGILRLQERPRIALFVRQDTFERFASCLVYVPRERYNSELRQRIGAILGEEFDGAISAFYTQIGESPLARVHFIVKTTPGKLPDYEVPKIESRLVLAARSWSDELRDALVDSKGEDRGLALFHRYAEAFTAAYRENISARDAVFEIDKIEGVLKTRVFGMNLYRPLEDPQNRVRFKIFHHENPVPLSDVLPMLENTGLKVLDEIPYRVRPEVGENGNGDGPTVWIHDFGMVAKGAIEVDLDRVKQKFEDAFARVWDGEVEDDGFNRLVLAAGLSWREVVVLRAYCKYLRQAAIPFSQTYMQETLASNPRFARLLVDLFAARFDPWRRARAKSRAAALVARFEKALDKVASLDEDRILRRFLNLVLATVRTNYFQTTEAGAPKPYVSFKLDSRKIDRLPLPRPMAEIFVYSPRTEGVHLRGGKVARGGIRWSDRREDFRTEILRLMKAQTVKNPVIVPVGAKGGFVVKRPPAEGGGKALMDEGVACYRTLMRGMLDVTDNLAGGEVAAPSDVVRHDGDDPYLVVAADKGTATFSDIANDIAREYGFWLDDAFASGGSAGYDHKKMGITARGAWEAVKRHFREIGVDIQNTGFTVAGVGSMAGDVFGNAMLLSDHIKLVAAFSQSHIFIDPDPDPAASFRERKRLFEMPRSAWSDYSPKLISKGGGVFERKAKSITLAREIKKLLDVSQDALTPNEVIQAILTAKVDLLWFGGIGTFVKASAEAHTEAGDRANDAVRVDAGNLRCRVIGEGANLAITQQGRVEIARAGGRLNTDAVDNSAGVDCSDHEVNIKTLLGEVMRAGTLTMKRRDGLLEEMTDEVAALVLRDNYLQTQALTVAEAQGVDLLDAQARLIRSLEREGRLDRDLEQLPDEEGLGELMAAKRGLTRPESAVLLAYAKLSLYDELLESDLPDEALLIGDLERYFPAPLREKYRKFIARHRLRREIIATHATNSMVNRLGGTFVNEMKERTGLPASEIARAYAVTRGAFGLRDLWSAIEALDNVVSAQAQTGMLLEAGRLVERCTLWFLQNARHPLDVAGTIGEFRPGIEGLRACLADVVSSDDLAALRRRAKRYTKQGVPEDLARQVASLDILVSACDIVRIAAAGKRAVMDVARTYFALGRRFGMDWLRTAAGRLSAETHWQREAVTAIVDELFTLQYELTTKVLDAAGATTAAEAAIDAWIGAHPARVDRTERLLGELETSGTPDLAMLAVANRQLRFLISG